MPVASPVMVVAVPSIVVALTPILVEVAAVTVQIAVGLMQFLPFVCSAPVVPVPQIPVQFGALMINTCLIATDISSVPMLVPIAILSRQSSQTQQTQKENADDCSLHLLLLQTLRARTS